jgi:hypothetical protein
MSLSVDRGLFAESQRCKRRLQPAQRAVSELFDIERGQYPQEDILAGRIMLEWQNVAQPGAGPRRR